jgi:hypothetical protein
MRQSQYCAFLTSLPLHFSTQVRQLSIDRASDVSSGPLPGLAQCNGCGAFLVSGVSTTRISTLRRKLPKKSITSATKSAHVASTVEVRGECGICHRRTTLTSQPRSIASPSTPKPHQVAKSPGSSTKSTFPSPVTRPVTAQSTAAPKVVASKSTNAKSIGLKKNSKLASFLSQL